MKMRKKIFYFLLVFLALTGGLYFWSDSLLEIGSRKALDYLVSKAPEYGFELSRPEFRNAEIMSVRSVAWDDLSIDLKLKTNPIFTLARDVKLASWRTVLGIESFWDRTFLLTAEGIDIAFIKRSGLHSSENEQPAPAQDRMEGGYLKIPFRLDFLRPWKISSQISWILENIEDLLNNGRCALPVTFIGSVTFSIQDKPFTARVRTQFDDGESVIFMNKADIEIISRGYDLQEPLTQAEIEILSQNPMRAPRLIRVKRNARAVSSGAREKDSSVPEDAYRHVLWSYLLVMEYGEEFAERVTDAHEQGRTGNTQEEKLMDINNNRVGRGYAKAGYPVSSILERLVADPDVILSPDQVSRREIDLLR